MSSNLIARTILHERPARSKPIASLLRSVKAIAGVTQARNYVAVIVEMIVDRRSKDRHVWMCVLKCCHPFGGGQKAKELDVLRAASFRRATAAMAEFPVASIGSTTTTKRSSRLPGTLK